MIGEPASMLAHKMRKICSTSANPDAMTDSIRLLLQAQRQTLVNNCIGKARLDRSNVILAHSKPIPAPLH